jgi:hypothetical protein
MSSDIDNNFQRSFIRSGNALEIYTTNELSPYFQIQNQPTFLDLDEGKSRDGDILAKENFPTIAKLNSNKQNKQNKHMTAQLILIIECKCLPDHGWIFTEGEINQFFWYSSSLIRNTTTLNELLGASSFLERIADRRGADELKSNQRTNNIHDSSVKLIKLSRGLIEEDKSQAKILYQSWNDTNEITFFKIYQPVIVFNGNLYLRKRNVEKIMSVRYLQLERQYKTNAYDEDVTIHVVSSKHIREYLSLIRSYYMRGSRHILENQNHIMEMVKENLIHWDDFNPFKIKI